MKHVKLVGAVVSHCDYIKYTAFFVCNV